MAASPSRRNVKRGMPARERQHSAVVTAARLIRRRSPAPHRPTAGHRRLTSHGRAKNAPAPPPTQIACQLRHAAMPQRYRQRRASAAEALRCRCSARAGACRVFASITLVAFADGWPAVRQEGLLCRQLRLLRCYTRCCRNIKTFHAPSVRRTIFHQLMRNVHAACR